jgi:hypothetical protein
MRILRGLSSRVLRCGCTAGVYETYSGEVVTVVDAVGTACNQAGHRAGSALSADEVEDLTVQAPAPARS